MEQAELLRELSRLHPASFGWALACVRRRSSDEALEILQESYLKVLEGRAKFAGKSSVKTWLFAVIRKTAAERHRRQLLRDLLRFRWLSSEEPPSRDPPPDRTAEAAQRRAHLLAALATLPARQRQVLELVFYHEMTIEEAATVMEVSLGTARVHYERGKKQLRERLTGGER